MIKIKLPTKNEKRAFPYALLFSLFMHAGLWGLGLSYLTNVNMTSNKNEDNLQKSPNSGNRIRLDEIKFITKKEIQKFKEKNAINRQIVANENNGKEEKTKETRFLSEKNQSFDRQTLARVNGAFKEAGRGQKDSDLIKEIESSERKIVESKKSRSQKEIGQTFSLDELGHFKMSEVEEAMKAEKIANSKEVAPEAQNNKVAQGLENGKRGVAGFSQSSDFVEDIPLGDMTQLNTTEFKYYGFYHRIRQKLEQHWGSTIKAKARNLYRSGRKLPESDNLITSLTVVLDHMGNIIDMKIEGTSGVRELDQAAIDSFNKAGPFPNPPKGLMVDGRAKIQWGFVVKS